MNKLSQNKEKKMRKLFQNKPFITGFSIPIFFLIFTHLVAMKFSLAELCDHCQRTFGFPFLLYKDYGDAIIISDFLSNILWFGLVMDALFALVLGIAIGFAFKIFMGNDSLVKVELAN